MVKSVGKLLGWFDNSISESQSSAKTGQLDWFRTLPYFAVHLTCFGVIWVGWSSFAVAVAIGLYLVRMLAITGFYHRYFSHRSFKTSRLSQFVFAFLGATAVQRGPIWWSAHHRHHHVFSEQEDDPHSPHQHGFLTSHTGWFLSREHFPVRENRVRDWMRFPELRLLDRFDIFPPIILALALLLIGNALEQHAPQLGTNGPQLLIWGFFISTVFLYHATFTINSLAHRWGRRRYKTRDDSRNNFWLALLTLGEGWHNNHHHYPPSARQGFYWWEIDVTWYFLKFLSSIGLVWDLKPVPVKRRESGKLE